MVNMEKQKQYRKRWDGVAQFVTGTRNKTQVAFLYLYESFYFNNVKIKVAAASC